ncbi:MAG: radical SAM protein [Polyangiaceae bacterium]
MNALKASRFNLAVPSGDDQLLFNSATTALLRVDAGAFAALQPLFPDGADGHRGVPRDYCAAPPAGLDDDLREALTEGGFLVPAELDELGVLRAAFEKSRSSQDLAFTIGLTMACNFACPYCFEEHRNEHLSPETAEAIRVFIARRMDDAQARSIYVNWFGGEPLLNVDVLVDLAAKLREETSHRGVAFSSLVITNGALLTRAVAERLVAAGVTRVQVTLDGPREIHDARRPMRGGQATFDRIVGNLKAVKGLIDVVIRVNVDEGNRPRVPELARYLAGEGLLSGERAMMMYTGKLTAYTEQVQMAWKPLKQSDMAGLEEDLESVLSSLCAPAMEQGSPLLGALQSGSCSATVDHSYVIGPRGHLFKCELGIHDVREAVGSVLESPAPEPGARRRLPLAPSSKGSLAHDWGAYNPFDNEKCSGCRYVPICKGGCPKRQLERDAEFLRGTCAYWDNNFVRFVTEFAG